MKNYYEILKINKISTEKEIKQAYRELAMEWHPDRNSSQNAHKMFIEINEAYEILIDPTKRSEYDKLFFGKREVSLSHEFNTWQKDARYKAETYASMDFEKFKERVLDEIILVAKHGTNFGCLGFLLCGFVVAIWFIINFAIKGDKDLVFLGFINLVVYGGLSLWLYPKITGAYKRDRKKLRK